MSFLETTTVTANPSEPILFEGELYKRGKVNQAWRKRWFVLTQNNELQYYESQQKFGDNKNQLGKIDLLQIQRIEVGLIQDIELSSMPKYTKPLSNNKCKSNHRSFLIFLTTQKRIYKLSANDSNSFLQWIRHLHTQLFEDVLYESMLEKKNDFCEYYFVLNKHKYLKYYNNEMRDMLHGYIDLNNPLSFTLTLQSTNQSMELMPDIENYKPKHNNQFALCTKDESVFNKWSDHLRNKNYNKSVMNDSDNFLIESEDLLTNVLNLSSRNLSQIPSQLCSHLSQSICTLNLSNNNLSSLEALKYFSNLTTLQLDRNDLSNIDDLPTLNKLTTLWLNNNNLKDINALLLILKQQCPNLEYLSLLFNPVCAVMNESENKKYRLTMIYHLPNLSFLDTQSVNARERHESLYGSEDGTSEDTYGTEEEILDSNLFRYKSEQTWSTMSLEQHEEELKNQLMDLVRQMSHKQSSRLTE